MSRTKNSIFNLITNFGSTLLLLVLNFVTRSIFIKTLGASYLGIEGLFSNILSVLSLAELGFGSAVVYKLYKPIEERNYHRILVLLKLYRRVYAAIGAAVFLLGLCLIPLLPTLIKDYGNLAELGLNATIVFLLYLFNSVSSYWFFAYKASFVQANQKSYLLTVVGYGLSVLNSVFQIAVLKFTRNFLAYVGVQISFTVLTSFVYALLCDWKYPFVREKVSESISNEEKKSFLKDCSALFLYKVSNVVINSTDNIVLSAVVGLEAVGLYANYLSLKVSIRSLLYSFVEAVQASIGSLYTTGNQEWSQLIFRVVNFLTFVLYGIVSIGFAILANDFLGLWIGPEFIVSTWSVGAVTVKVPLALLIAIELYLTGQKYYCGMYRSAMGLFQELKYRPIASMLINLLVCLLLVPYIGMAGCVISTIVAALTTNLIFDPIIIHRHALNADVKPYFFRNILYKIVTIAAGFLSWILCRAIPVTGVLGFVIHGCICVLVPGFIFVVCFFRCLEFRYLWRMLTGLLPRTRCS